MNGRVLIETCEKMVVPKIGIVDTMFARYDMAKDVITVFEEFTGRITYERYTVPGIKDLPVAALKLIEERGCDLVIALGMPGPKAYDKMSAQVASTMIGQCQLMTRKHVIEVFVHEDEGKDDRHLKAIMKDRATKHAYNAIYLLLDPSWLTKRAGQGIRQGHEDAGPVNA